jgi:hypothetical protein
MAEIGGMKNRPQPAPPRRRRGAARGTREAPAATAAAEASGLVGQSDGWYWVAPDGQQAFGPFASRSEAHADRDRYSEQAPVEGEPLREAVREIGSADWVDAETGEATEGQSPPYLEEP